MPIMLRNGKAATLTMAALFAAGCAQSDYIVSRNARMGWQRVNRETIANAPQAVLPKILPETYYAAGQLFEAQGLLGKAIMQYRKAVAVNHQYMDAFQRLGVLLGAVGRHKEATDALRRAVQLRPDDAILRNNLGFEFVLRQRWEDARRELSRAIALRPQFARAHINLGMTLCQLNRFDEALVSFQAALPAPDAYYNLALMLRGQQHYQDAADALDHALSIAPQFMAASIQLEQLAERLEPTTPPVTPPDEHTTPGIATESHVDIPMALVQNEPTQADDEGATPPADGPVTEADVASFVETTDASAQVEFSSATSTDTSEVAGGDRTFAIEGYVSSEVYSWPQAFSLYEPFSLSEEYVWSEAYVSSEEYVSSEAYVSSEEFGSSEALDVVDEWVREGTHAPADPCEDEFFEDLVYRYLDGPFSFFAEDFSFADEESTVFPVYTAVAQQPVEAAGLREVEARTEETPDYDPVNLRAPAGTFLHRGDSWLTAADTSSERKTLGERIIIEEPTYDLLAPPGVELILPGVDTEVKERKPVVLEIPSEIEIRDSREVQGSGATDVGWADALEHAPGTAVVEVQGPGEGDRQTVGRADLDTSAVTDTRPSAHGLIRAPQITKTQGTDVPQVEEPVMRAAGMEAFVPETSIERLAALRLFDQDLAAVQEEIRCWEELLAERAEARESANEAVVAEAQTALVDISTREVTDHPATGLMDTHPVKYTGWRPVPHVHIPDVAVMPRPTMSKTVVEAPASPTPIDRRAVVQSLEQDLASVRREIECWENMLAEQTEARRSAVAVAEAEAARDTVDIVDSANATERIVPTDAAEALDTVVHPGNATVRAVGADAFVPATDWEPALYPPTPPVEPAYAAMFAAVAETLPSTSIYGDDVDALVRIYPVPRRTAIHLREMTTVMTLRSAPKSDHAEDGAFLISRVWEESIAPAGPAATEMSPESPTRATLSPGVDIAGHVAEEVASNWDVTFGDVQDLFSVVRNEMECWESLGVSDLPFPEQFESPRD